MSLVNKLSTSVSARNILDPLVNGKEMSEVTSSVEGKKGNKIKHWREIKLAQIN